MSILASVMRAAQSVIPSQGAGGGTEKEDPIAKEHRTAYRKLMESAVKEGNQQQIAALSKSAPPGVDPSLYVNIAGMQTPAQQHESIVNEAQINALNQFVTGQTPPAPAPTTQPIDTTFDPPQPEPPPVIAEPAPTTDSLTPNLQTRTRDVITRSAIKKFFNVDIEPNYFASQEWFKDYDNLRNQNISSSAAKDQLAAKYGFIPSGASNLTDLPEVEREILFERDLAAWLNDPELDAVLKEIVPEGINFQKYKMGKILETIAGKDGYIPDQYQPMLERSRGLEDPAFISNDVQSYIYQTTGKTLTDITPDDVATARKQMQNEHIVQVAREASATTSARLKAEFALEESKPITSADRLKEGIPTKYKTAQELVDAGYKFPTQADKKLYGDYYAIMNQMDDLRTALFGTKANPGYGIFTGIKTDAGSRTVAKPKLLKDLAFGNDRGQNLEYYNDILASLARTLLKMANSGSSERPTDVDITQIMHSAPDPGGLISLPDSEAVALRKYNRFIKLVGTQLERLRETTTIGLSTKKSPPAKPTDQYEINKTYTNAEGQQAIYKGEGNWEPITKQ